MSSFPTLDQRAMEEEREEAEAYFELQSMVEQCVAEVLMELKLGREATLH